MKILLREAALRPSSEPVRLGSALSASALVRSSAPTVPESQHPSPTPRKRHKKQSAEWGQSPALKMARHGNQSRVRSKSEHTSVSVPQKSTPLTPAPAQAPLTPVPDELSTSAAQSSTNAARDHLLLLIPVSRQYKSWCYQCQQSGGSPLVLVRVQHLPFSTIKRETGCACLGADISISAPVSATSGNCTTVVTGQRVGGRVSLLPSEESFLLLPQAVLPFHESGHRSTIECMARRSLGTYAGSVALLEPVGVSPSFQGLFQALLFGGLRNGGATSSHQAAPGPDSGIKPGTTLQD